MKYKVKEFIVIGKKVLHNGSVVELDETDSSVKKHVESGHLVAIEEKPLLEKKESRTLPSIKKNKVDKKW